MERINWFTVWKQPIYSGAAFVLIHVVFWMILQFQWRLCGVVSLSCLLLFLYRSILEHYGEIGRPPLQWTERILRSVSNFYDTLLMLRDRYPNPFKIYSIVILLALHMLGRTVPGCVIAYSIVLGFFARRFVVTLLPEKIQTNLQEICATFQLDHDISEDDLIPTVMNGSDKDIDNQSIAESCTSSFISGLPSMPSYLEIEGSLDGLDDDDLDITATQLRTMTALHDGSDSDSENGDINLEFSPMNNSTSSSDESKYVEDMAFTPAPKAAPRTHKKPRDIVVPTVSHEAEPSSSEGGWLRNISSDLLANVSVMRKKISAALHPETGSDASDCESDFELIDPNDVTDCL